MAVVRGNEMIHPVVPLIAEVIKKEDTHHILQFDLKPLEIIVQHIAALQAPPETLKIWLQLLLNNLAEAKDLLDRSGVRRQRCLDWLVNSPRRQSQQIRGWNAFFDHSVSHLIRTELPVSIIHPVLQGMAEVINFRPLEIVVQDIAALFPDQQKAPPEIVKIWLQLLLNSVAESIHLLDRPGRRQRCLDCLVNNPRRQSQQIRGRNAVFDRLSHLIQTELPMLLTSLHFLSSKPLCKELRGVAAPGSVDSRIKRRRRIIAQTLSGEEGWMLFRRVAFREERVSMDIEERARIIADECKGRPLAINLVAKSMIGQSSVHEWDVCLSSLKKVHPSFPAIHCSLNAELYRLLRWSYDSLPNSIVKSCFLYCALYEQGQQIDSRQLVEMWIGEGLIKSKQGAYLMDMAIGRNYVKLLVDRCLFHIINESTTNVLGFQDVFPSIGVDDVIREMAVYIAQKEQNRVLMSSQNPPNLPENCTRISLQLDNYTGDLPTDLRCPNLVSLCLQSNRHLELLPTELVLSRLTSLRVLNMSGCTKITSVPTSVRQLRLLQFLSLSGLHIKDLGEDICHLSQLQFLDLSGCENLESLPSQIGELKKLKHLNLDGCLSLKMIPREISELTSLSRLLLPTDLSVRMEAPASVWSLKGLQNLMELYLCIDSEPFTDGIMETWSEMRHFILVGSKNLPDDMQNMKKLQSFALYGCAGLTLPDSYKFQHLGYEIRELSPLEWLPNLKYLKLWGCSHISELGIGSRVPSGYRRLQILILKHLYSLEGLGGPSNAGVWDESTLPHLRVLKIDDCPRLKRLPMGMEKLRNLCELQAQRQWWEKIRWDDDNMKVQLQKVFVSL